MAEYTHDRIIRLLGMEPHPREGGWFVETWRCPEGLAGEALAERYGGPRSVSTAIYYLLARGAFSEMHRLRSDEVFHHYLGDPVEMLLLHPDGRGEIVVLGKDFPQGERPQVVVPRGVWQGCKLRRGVGYALMGCTVAPGFEYDDYERGDRETLTEGWPEFAEKIAALTHE